MRGHSALPNMLTRSRSAANSGSKEPFATGSMVLRQRHRPSQAPGRLMPRWCSQDLGAEDDMVLIHELLGVG